MTGSGSAAKANGYAPHERRIVILIAVGFVLLFVVAVVAWLLRVGALLVTP